MHRKVWEYCYITQALHERGMLAPGRRGLGFAVGQEPLSAMFASLGSEILATDWATEEAQKSVWVKTNQHADSMASLNGRRLCESALFHQRVRFRFLDMRKLHDGLGKFDFIWSGCSLEHLGTMAAGEKFIYESLKYLRPGGVAVHTTEYNVQSNSSTITKGETVIFRQQDIERIAGKLNRMGYRVDLDFSAGNLPYDTMIDEPPYKNVVSIRILLSGYIVTSFGLIIQSRR
jgi:2-polyprenyl-3-methyl-5-hydroxy-6-metoxy-1,4-benzoquinol methylase